MKIMQETNGAGCSVPVKCLIIVYSYHHGNTLKIAEEFAGTLSANVITPDQVVLIELEQYDIIGFGAGIDSGRHYKPLLDLADTLPVTDGKQAFIFSTSGIQGYAKVAKDHSVMREKLQSKGFTIIGEFSCKGYNTNRFLQYFGGMNKGKPDSTDLKNAREFAIQLLR